MLDTHHLGTNTPARYTHWEVHPVTEFEVCTLTKTKFNQGDEWVKLEDLEP